MHGLIDVCAEALRAELPVFTRRNLFYAVGRARGAAMTEAGFNAALARRLSRGALPGLLPEGRRARLRPPAHAADTSSPEAVLLVDRPAIRDLFVTSGASTSARLAMVCIDGTPAPVVARLRRGFQAGLRAPVLYLHDAATVVYPFTLEPLATLVGLGDSEHVVYADLGLPPLGATARRFDDPTLPDGEPIRDLEAIPPATLLRYAITAARRLGAGATDGAGRRTAP